MSTPLHQASLGEPSPLGPPALWHADAAHAVVSIVDIRSEDHGCDFALHTSTVELDTRPRHTSLDLHVELEPVVCARCGTPLYERASTVPVLRWSAPHCVMASSTHPNLLVAAGTLTVASLGRPVELVGSATVHDSELYLHITGSLPRAALGPHNGGSSAQASITVTAQLRRVHALGSHPGA